MQRLRWLLFEVLAAALLCTPSAATSAGELPDGTLLFLENCSSVVERTTHGEIAHVAIVLREEQQPWIYEATPAKVRRVKMDDYLVEIARTNERRKDNDPIRILA